jgi:hypothetical protein
MRFNGRHARAFYLLYNLGQVRRRHRTGWAGAAVAFAIALALLWWRSGARDGGSAPPPQQAAASGAPPNALAGPVGTAARFALDGRALDGMFPPERWEVVDLPGGIPCSRSDLERRHSCGVSDGDTIRLPDGTRVRYLEVNAPEMGGDAGLEAWRMNHRWVAGRPLKVYLLRDAHSHGRRVGYVFAREGDRWALVNAVLFEQFLAAGMDPEVVRKYFDGAQAHVLRDTFGIH